jgi:hypothetical protein
MLKCPVCFKQANIKTMQFSTTRSGVLICSQCSYDKMDFEKWKIDSSKPTQSLMDYFDAREDFITAYNCSDDRKEVEMVKKKYDRLKALRVAKLVVAVEGGDGISPLAEFTDMNLALALVFGWLGDIYEKTGKTRWVSMHGAVIQIVEM